MQDLQFYREMDEAAFSECLGHPQLVNTIAIDWRPKTVGVYCGHVCNVSYPWAERPCSGTRPLQFVTWERMIILERMDGARASFLGARYVSCLLSLHCKSSCTLKAAWHLRLIRADISYLTTVTQPPCQCFKCPLDRVNIVACATSAKSDVSMISSGLTTCSLHPCSIQAANSSSDSVDAIDHVCRGSGVLN